MDPRKVKWIPNPTRKQVIIFSAVWLSGVLMVLFASTNFFTESLFYRQNFVLFFLILLSSLAIFGVWKNYLSNK